MIATVITVMNMIRSVSTVTDSGMDFGKKTHVKTIPESAAAAGLAAGAATDLISGKNATLGMVTVVLTKRLSARNSAILTMSMTAIAMLSVTLSLPVSSRTLP